MTDGTFGGDKDRWEQVRLGLAFAGAWLRKDTEAINALLGCAAGPEVLEVAEGLVALTAAWASNLADCKPFLAAHAGDDEPNEAVAEFLASYCAELSAGKEQT